MHFILVSPMVNGEQPIEFFDTYAQAIEFATVGDRIYKLEKEVE